LSDATESCDVVILGFDASRDEPPEAGLQRVFGINAASAGKLIANLPMTVQRRVPRVRAEYFRRALDGIGAEVEVRDGAGNALEMLQPQEPTRSAAPPPPSRPPAGPAPAADGPAATAATLDDDTLVDPTPPPGLDMGQAGAALRATIAAETGAPVPEEPHQGPSRPRDQVTRPIAPTALDAPAPRPTEAAGDAVRPPAHPTVREAAPERPPREPQSDLPPPPGLGMPEWASAPPADDDPKPPPGPPPGSSTVFGDGGASTPEIRRRYINDSAVYDPPPASAGAGAGAPGAGAPTTHAEPGPAHWAPREEPEAPAPFSSGADPADGPAARKARRGAVAATQVDQLPSDVWGSGNLPALGEVTSFDDPSLPPPGRAGAAREAGDDADPPQVLRGHRVQHRRPEFDMGAAIPATAPVRAPASDSGPNSGLELDERAVPDRRRRRGAARPDADGPRGDRGHPDAGPRGDRAHRSAGGDAPDPQPPRPDAAQPVAAIGMARAGDPSGAAPSSADTASFLTDTRNFWESFTDGFTTPFLGTGLYWVITIAVWSIVVAAIGVLAGYMMIVGAIVSFIANASLFAVTCDYFRATFWTTAMGESEVDRKPQFDPSVMLDLYFKQGLHLMFFMALTQFMAVWWAGARIVGGTALFDVLTDPVLWLLTLLPSFYWPAGVTLTAANHEFGAIWNVPAGFRLILRAPLEYCTIVFTGLAIMVATAVVFGALGHFLGATGSLLTGTVGLPLALSHGVMGALAGNLARARPEALED
jgi:hypothetical protein